jgi:hypothetical protein
MAWHSAGPVVYFFSVGPPGKIGKISKRGDARGPHRHLTAFGQMKAVNAGLAYPGRRWRGRGLRLVALPRNALLRDAVLTTRGKKNRVSRNLQLVTLPPPPQKKSPDVMPWGGQREWNIIVDNLGSSPPFPPPQKKQNRKNKLVGRV